MSRPTSDFRMGVEAAARWLMADALRCDVPLSPKQEQFAVTQAKTLTGRMLIAFGYESEDVEAQTVTQVIKYLREWSVKPEVNDIFEQVIGDLVRNEPWKHR